jgi:probable O-glycosylation ligase (exosortase A-associated)
MRDVILTLIIFGAVPFILRKPAIGIFFWIWLGLMNPQRLVWGFAYTLPFSMIVAGATVAGLFLTREPRQWKGGAAAWVLLAFVAWMVVTTPFAMVPDRAVLMLERVLKIQFATFLALLVLYRREHVLATVWVMAMSIGYYAVKGGLFTLLTLGAHRVWGPPDSFIFDNNSLALATVITIPLWAYLFVQHRNRWLRFTLAICIALSTVSALGSHSRGALLAVLAISAFLWTKAKHKLALGIVFVVLGVGLLAFMPQNWETRMNTIREYQGDASAQGRLQTWKMLFNLAVDRPFLGGGFEPYQRWIFERYNPEFNTTLSAHSIYFQVLGEHGFVGLALFLAFWALVWRRCAVIRRMAREDQELRWAYWLAQLVQVSIIGYLVGGTFLNLAYWDMPYYLFVLVAVTGHIVERHSPTPAAQARVAARGSFA